MENEPVSKEESSLEFFVSDFFKNDRRILSKVAWGLFLALLFLFIFFWAAPRNFPVDRVIRIEEGLSLHDIADFLDEENVIKSPFWFKTFSYLSGNQGDILSGDYFFTERTNLFGLLGKVLKGDFGIDSINITIPEGTTIVEIPAIFKIKFEDFDGESFIKEAEGREGYLFPDTYRFLPDVGPKEILSTMEENFSEKILKLEAEINGSGRSLEDIIIMASLLEEEARTQETREIIAGILWKRLDLGIALQVDAVFPYIIGKNTYEVTLDDLKIDSPYNTYLYRGLPLGPISNPGLSSITAALRPKDSPYLFYLSDREGNMYYAEDFEGHKRNRELYLR